MEANDQFRAFIGHLAAAGIWKRMEENSISLFCSHDSRAGTGIGSVSETQSAGQSLSRYLGCRLSATSSISAFDLGAADVDLYWRLARLALDKLGEQEQAAPHVSWLYGHCWRSHLEAATLYADIESRNGRADGSRRRGFEPALEDGRAVESRYELSIDFKIKYPYAPQEARITWRP